MYSHYGFISPVNYTHVRPSISREVSCRAFAPAVLALRIYSRFASRANTRHPDDAPLPTVPFSIIFHLLLSSSCQPNRSPDRNATRVYIYIYIFAGRNATSAQPAVAAADYTTSLRPSVVAASLPPPILLPPIAPVVSR